MRRWRSRQRTPSPGRRGQHRRGPSQGETSKMSTYPAGPSGGVKATIIEALRPKMGEDTSEHGMCADDPPTWRPLELQRYHNSSSQEEGKRASLVCSAPPARPEGPAPPTLSTTVEDEAATPFFGLWQLWLLSNPLRDPQGRHLHQQWRYRHRRYARRSAWSLPWAVSFYTNKLPR